MHIFWVIQYSTDLGDGVVQDGPEADSSMWSLLSHSLVIVRICHYLSNIFRELLILLYAKIYPPFLGLMCLLNKFLQHTEILFSKVISLQGN